MKRLIYGFLFTTLVWTIEAQSQYYAYDQGYQLPTGPNEIKILSYNVENLFNAVPNPGKEDWTHLPKNHPLKARCGEIENTHFRIVCYQTDWTEDKYILKLYQLARAVYAQGDLPDVLALAEVESEDVVYQLGQLLGYTNYVFFDGPDERGIDTALLYNGNKLELIHWYSVNFSPSGARPTRNILKANFIMRGSRSKDVLGVYVNHWPSQSNPTEYRILAAQTLANEIEAEYQRHGYQNYHAVAVGDFNSTSDERPHPVNDFIINPGWWPNHLVDIHHVSDYSDNPMNGVMPWATHYYATKDVWDRLDKILVSQNFFDGKGMEAIPESFRVVAPSFMLMPHKKRQNEWVPMRYNFDTLDPEQAGYSDHFPIVVKLRFQ